ncbi:MAG: hypothetical protein WC264_03930 [Candidatus Paceibacterota bacterium]|jgi:hypothetical protein
MELKKLISLSKHHENLCNKIEWYSKWHKHPYHKHAHYFAFSFFVLFSIIIVYNSYIFKPDFIQADDKKDANIDNVDISAEEKDKKQNEEIKEKKDKEENHEEDRKEEKNDEIQTEEILEDIVDEKKQETEDVKEENKFEEKSPEKVKEEVEEIIIIEKIADFINEKAENIEEIEIITDETVVIQNDEQIIDLNGFITDIEENTEIPVEEKSEKNKDEENEKIKEEEKDQEKNKEIENEKILNTVDEIPPAEEITIPTLTEDPLIEELPTIEEPIILPIIPVSGTTTVLDVTSPVRNNKYRTGPISIHVVFSKPVEVTGSPSLGINTGNPTETQAEYESGSGTDTLIFVYNIAPSNSSSDLDYSSIDSLSLNSGSIKDTDGNDTSVILPIPNSAHSLSGNKDIKIDTIVHKPTIIYTD